MLEIHNFTTNKVDEKFLKRTVEAVFQVINKKGFPKLEEWGKIEISLAIVGNARMRKLNKMYRGKNRVTDVLAFGDKSVFNFLSKDEFVEAPDEINHLGEIVICYPQAKKQAKEAKHTLKKEVSILLVHGILHLLGYDHEKGNEEAELMGKTQEKALERLSIE